MRKLVWHLASILLVLAASAARAECPLNQGMIGYLQNCALVQSMDPVYSVSGGSCFNGNGWIDYDLTAGTLEVTSWSASHEGFLTFMRITDDYVITGPPSGTPIPFTVICTAQLSDPNACVVRMDAGTASVSTSFTGPGTQVLRLELAKLPGESFSVSIRADVPANRNTRSASASMQFTALPSGYGLTSCQGYAAQPVGTRVTSWGRVKQLFR